VRKAGDDLPLRIQQRQAPAQAEQVRRDLFDVAVPGAGAVVLRRRLDQSVPGAAVVAQDVPAAVAGVAPDLLQAGQRRGHLLLGLRIQVAEEAAPEAPLRRRAHRHRDQHGGDQHGQEELRGETGANEAVHGEVTCPVPIDAPDGATGKSPSPRLGHAHFLHSRGADWPDHDDVD
jgi:hypothetical protein